MGRGVAAHHRYVLLANPAKRGVRRRTRFFGGWSSSSSMSVGDNQSVGSVVGNQSSNISSTIVGSNRSSSIISMSVVGWSSRDLSQTCQ